MVLKHGPAKKILKLSGDSIEFWEALYEHPNYNVWWQARNARVVNHRPYQMATLVVGGLYDAEDGFGAWNVYKAIKAKSPGNNNKFGDGALEPW